MPPFPSFLEWVISQPLILAVLLILLILGLVVLLLPPKHR